jgi:uncharacterized protein YchJ
MPATGPRSWTSTLARAGWASRSRSTVEFVARQRDAAGRAHRLHERSRFVREGGRWHYLDGMLR